MDKFVGSIKKKYKERLLIHGEQWPPVYVEKLINLQLVETDKKEGFGAGLPQNGASGDDQVKRTPILRGDLFKVDEGKKPVRKLIVEGHAGMGKTTLCTMLAEAWAEGKIFTQFDCVLLFPLRERSVSSANTLPQLFKLLHSSERIRMSAVEELEEREGEGILIIADGWDELDSSNRSNDSFLYNLLFGHMLPFVSVLLTSRPSASAFFHRLSVVDRLVEVVGFNEANIQQYIESEFAKYPEKAASLIEQVEKNPVVQSVCSVPLNCAIICNLWHTLNQMLPHTLTKLYTLIVLNLILRDFLKKRYPTECSTVLSINSFDSIPDHLQDMFWLVCKFAYECLSRDRIVFSQEEMVSLFPKVVESSDNFLCFGLLQCAHYLLPVGHDLSFHFIHLTIQEFLAALHLVTLSNTDKLKVCKAHCRKTRFEFVWRFMFGLGSKEEGRCSRKVICLDDAVVDSLISVHKGVFGGCLIVCHYAMESEHRLISTKVANQVNGQLFSQRFLKNSIVTLHDCEALYHVLHHTLHCSSLRIDLSGYSLSDKHLEEFTDILSRAGKELQVNALDLHQNQLTAKSVSDLFSRASASFCSLKDLIISDNKIANLDPVLSICKNLESLNISDNPLGVSDIQLLEEAIQANSLVNLSVLSLSNTLTSDADVNGALLTTLLPSIAFHCPGLDYLDLSRNNLGAPGACVALGDGFLHITSNRERLDLFLIENNISGEELALFSNIITSTSRFENKCTCTIMFSNNPLGCSSLRPIFKMLRSEACSITALNLNNTNLLNSNSDCLCIEHVNTTGLLDISPISDICHLTSLSLGKNNLSNHSIFILAEFIRNCKSLGGLSCDNCSLSSTDITTLLSFLKSHHIRSEYLRKWTLGDNLIDDEGVTTLIESIPELFPCLEMLDISYNPVSDKIKKSLADYLWVRDLSSLCDILLNPIDTD